MTVALCVFTDGRRDCIAQAIPSLLFYLHGPITARIIHDDSGDPAYRLWLAEQFPDFTIIGTETRQGFGGAYQNAWKRLALLPELFVFSTEDDFVLTKPVELTQMMTVLHLDPGLVQLVLRRQPWNDEERQAGGIVEQHPDDYIDVSVGNMQWLEHRRFYSTNPSLHSRALCERGWPGGSHSEGVFTHQLLEDPMVRFAFWGGRDSGEWCRHVGVERVGCGY